MNAGPTRGDDHGDLGRFLLITFAINWVVTGAYIVAPDPATRLLGHFGLTSPAFFVGVYAPTLAALAVVSRRRQPKDALAKFLGRLLIPAPWMWFVVAAVLLPALLILGQVVCALLGFRAQWPDLRAWGDGLSSAVLSFRLLTDPGALGEELGWRGFVLPLLLQRYTAVRASCLLGLVWGLWHLPAFFIPTLPQSTVDIPAFIALAIALSVLMTWLHVRTSGNVIACGVLPHFMINVCLSTEQVRIDWETNAIVWTFVALLVLRHGPGLDARFSTRQVARP